MRLLQEDGGVPCQRLDHTPPRADDRRVPPAGDSCPRLRGAGVSRSGTSTRRRSSGRWRRAQHNAIARTRLGSGCPCLSRTTGTATDTTIESAGKSHGATLSDGAPAFFALLPKPSTRRQRRSNSVSSREQRGDDVVDGRVGEGPHLVVGAVLDRVGDEHAAHVDAERRRPARRRRRRTPSTRPSPTARPAARDRRCRAHCTTCTTLSRRAPR